MKMKNNMKTPRIEEMVEQSLIDLDEAQFEMLESGTHKGIRGKWRYALTKLANQAHQAGIDEMVEKVMPFLKAYKQSLDCDWSLNPVQTTNAVYRSSEAVLRDQANAIEAKRKMARDLEDTIKALQD